MDNWYVRVKGRVLGPYTLGQLQQLRERGQVQPFHEVSTDRASWQPAGNIDALSPQTAFTSRVPAATASSWLPVAPEPPVRPKTSASLPLLLIAGSVLGVIGILAVVVVVLVVVTSTRHRAPAPGPVALAEPEPTRRMPAPVGEHFDAPEPVEEPPQKPVTGPADGNGAAPGNVPPAPPAPPEKPPAPNTTGLISFNPQTDPVKRHKAIKSSVGLVLCGLDVTFLRDGKRVEAAESSGTCFAVSEDGLLLTNRHVVEEVVNQKRASDIKRLEREHNAKIIPTVWVFFSRADKHVAEVKYISDSFDLAVLKINRKSPAWFALSGKPVEEIVPDLSVSACGFPGLQRDIIKMATGKDIQRSRGPVEGQFPDEAFSPNQEAGKVTTEPYTFEVRKVMPECKLTRNPKCIQHTADIFHGNSGGPLILADGAVIGINTYGFTAKKGDDQKKVNLSITLPQLKEEIERQVPGLAWR